MPIKDIEQYKEEFVSNFPTKEQVISSSKVGWCFTKRFKDKLEKALKQRTEAVIREMLVEERDQIGKLNPNLLKREKAWVNSGFNQCCALQREYAKEIKDKLKICQDQNS